MALELLSIGLLESVDDGVFGAVDRVAGAVVLSLRGVFDGVCVDGVVVGAVDGMAGAVVLSLRGAVLGVGVCVCADGVAGTAGLSLRGAVG